jgi:RNA polymerase sigma factor (sigma-70 family)
MSIALLSAPAAGPDRRDHEPASHAAGSWSDIYWELRRDRNSRAAWDALEHRVRRWARRGLARRGQHVVEDAVADTCAEVVLSFARARGVDTFHGFVYGHYLNARRRALQELVGRDAPIEGIDLPAPPDHEPDETALEALARALETLSARERRAIELRYFAEQPIAGVAAALGLTENNARQILLRARRRLREAIGAALAEDEPGWRAGALLPVGLG